MNDKDKTKEQLINELKEVRQRISELEKSKTELKRAEEALRESEERFRNITENALEWIWEVDANGKYTYASPVVEKILGYKPEEVLKKHFYDLFCPEEREKLKKAAFDVFLKKQPFREFINKNMHKNGKTVCLSTSGSPILDRKANLLGYRGADIDITERKRIEEALRESEEKYRNVVELSNDGIGIIQDGLVKYANNRYAKIGGYRVEEVIDKPFTDFIHPDELPRVIERYKRRMAGEDVPSIYETALKHKNGRKILVEINVGIITYHGKPAELGYARDITDRKQTEKALRDSEEQYKTLTNNVNVGLYRNTTGPKGKFVEVNPAIIKMFGYESKEEFLSINVADLYQNPKDRKKYNDKILKHGFVKNEELKLRKKDRTPFFGSVSAVAVKDEKGNVKYYDGIIEDITDRKNAEQALLEGEVKYREVVDNSLIGLYIMQNNIIKFCNQRFAEMFGFGSSEEVLDRNMKELVAPESWEFMDKKVKLRESGERESVQFEFKGVKKDRTIFDIETSGSSIIYEGNPAIQGSMIDITARKRTEEELRILATTDVLTGVLNRGYALLLFGKELKFAKRNNQKLSICYVDVDRLKDINDTYGHLEGDEALKIISRFLKEAVREVDIVCRLGGDEFLLIFPQCKLIQSYFIWERIAYKMTTFNARKIKPYIISLSHGFAEYDPAEEKSVDYLIAYADHEMYKDKHLKSTS